MSFPFEDADLDRHLQDVPLPDGFLARLTRIGEMPDQELDRSLVDVPLPPGLVYRLRGTLRRERRDTSRNRLMLAASILLALGFGSYLGALGWMMSVRREAAVGTRMKPDDAPAPSVKLVMPSVAPAPQTATDNQDVSPEETIRPLGFAKHGPPQRPHVPTATAPAATVQQTTDSASESSLPREDIFAYPTVRLPELPSVSGLKPRGIAPPHVKGYDLTFQLKNREHPFVSLAAAPALKTSCVPMITDTASFDVLCEAVSRGKLPPPDALRLEELLAAVDYQFAPPVGAPLAIRTAAGPSPLATGNVLLQVAVQAAAVQPAATAPGALIVALDASSNLQSPARSARLLMALTDYARHQGPTARTQIVEYSSGCRVLCDLKQPQDADRLAGQFNLQSSVTRRDWTTGLQAVLDQAAALVVAGQAAPRIVIISAGPSEISPSRADWLDAEIKKSAAAGVKVDAIDIDQEESEVNAQLARCAAAGSGSVHKLAGADQLRWALAEIVADCSLVAADNVRLEVTFNPKAVAAYRLIGHEATAGGGLLSAPVAGELRSGQAATGLYEVILKPDGAPQIATVEVTWSPPGITQPKTRTQSISRLQVANTLLEAPLSLQAAALVAEAGEVLRGSYFAPANAHSLRRVRELVAQANPRLQDNPSVVRLLDVIDRAARLFPSSSRTAK